MPTEDVTDYSSHTSVTNLAQMNPLSIIPSPRGLQCARLKIRVLLFGKTSPNFRTQPNFLTMKLKIHLVTQSLITVMTVTSLRDLNHALHFPNKFIILLINTEF